MSTLICFALKEEATPFRKIAAGKAAPAQVDLSILLTGIGRRNAGKSVLEFLAGGASVPASRSQGQARLARTLAPPDLVLTCGFAGGLNPDLKLGDLVFEIPDRRDEFHESQTKKDAGNLIGDSRSSSLREKLVAAGARHHGCRCLE